MGNCFGLLVWGLGLSRFPAGGRFTCASLILGGLVAKQKVLGRNFVPKGRLIDELRLPENSLFSDSHPLTLVCVKVYSHAAGRRHSDDRSHTREVIAGIVTQTEDSASNGKRTFCFELTFILDGQYISSTVERRGI